MKYYKIYLLIIKTIYMAKRSTNLGIKPKSIHSRKTKKRLAIKKEMLAKKAAGRKNKK